MELVEVHGFARTRAGALYAAQVSERGDRVLGSGLDLHEQALGGELGERRGSGHAVEDVGLAVAGAQAEGGGRAEVRAGQLVEHGVLGAARGEGAGERVKDGRRQQLDARKRLPAGLQLRAAVGEHARPDGRGAVLMGTAGARARRVSCRAAALVAAALIVAWTWHAAPVGAEVSSTFRLPFMPASPVFMGDDLVWTEAREDQGFDIVRAPVSGGPPRVMTSFTTSGTGIVMEPTLAASATRLALEVRRRILDFRDGGTLTDQTYLGPAGEDPAPLSDPCSFGVPGFLRSVDVEDDSVAHRARPCPEGGLSGPGQAAAVSTFAPSGVATQPLEPGAAGMRLAGSFVAYVASDGLVVSDLRRGSDLYRVPIPRRLGLITSIDLRADGALAVTFQETTRRSGFRARLAVATPSAPRLRVVPLPAAGHLAVRFVGDRVLVMRAPRGSTSTVTGATLELRDFATGRLVKVLARGVEDQFLRDKFDVDEAGQEVVYMTRSCTGAALYVQPLSAPTRTFRAPRRCAPAMSVPPRLSADRRRVVFQPSCRGFQRDCTGGNARASVLVRDQGRVRRRLFARGVEYYLPGFTVLRSLRLTRFGRAYARSHRRVRVRLSYTITDPDPFINEPELEAQRRSGTFVLGAP